jgi:hypothetical protein
VSRSVLRLHFVHLFKKESASQLPSAVLKNATPYYRGKPAVLLNTCTKRS